MLRFIVTIEGKIGDKLIKGIVDLCKDNNIASMTLEVRASNKIAQNLYRKYGFKMGGIRKNTTVIIKKMQL